MFKPVCIDNRNYVTLMQFLSNSRLLVCYDSNKFLIHDIESKSLTKFSKQNLKNFPINFLNQYNRIYGCIELSDSMILLYSHFTYIKIDLTCKMPEQCRLIQNHPSKTDTRVMNWNEASTHHHKKYMALLPHRGQGGNYTQSEEATQGDKKGEWNIENKFKGIMYMGRLQDGTLVVVENLWKNLLTRLPQVLQVDRFGQ